MSVYVKRYGKKGYKGTDNYKCREVTYKVGETYTLPNSSAVICRNGYHYCDKAKDTLKYYSYDQDFKLLEIIDLSKKSHKQDDKIASTKIKIVREITDPKEIMKLLGCYKEWDKNGNERIKTATSEQLRDKIGKVIEQKNYIDKTEYHYYYEKYFFPYERTIIYSKDLLHERFFHNDGRIKKQTNLNTGLVTNYKYFSSKHNFLLKEKSSSDGTCVKYDAKGCLIFERFADRTSVVIKYNDNGDLLSAKWSDGQKEECIYNKYNLLVSYTHTNGNYIKNKYKGRNLYSSERFVVERFNKGDKVNNSYFKGF